MQKGLTKNRFDGLQIIRAYASILVVFFHLSIFFFYIKNESIFGNFFLTGFSGVDIFFVLSGFIISYSSSKYINIENIQIKPRLKNLKIYFLKRFFRIYPTYWLFLYLPILLIAIILPTINDYHPNNFLKILNTILLNFGHDEVSIVTWTLSYELFFYIIFGMVILNKRLTFLFIPLFILIIYKLTQYDGKINYDVENQYSIFKFQYLNYITNPIILEFFFGVFMYFLCKKGISINHKTSLIFISIYVISFFATNYIFAPNYQNFFKFYRIFFYGVPAFLLIFAFINISINYENLIFKKIILLGDASYILYLIHNTILSIFVRFFLFKIENNFLVLFLAILMVIIICYISILLYQFVEKPLLSYLNRRFLKN